MGAWDVMSSHYIGRNLPPPGLSSFTKIRLGWIAPGQVILVKPGDTRGAFLSPLDGGGKTLAIKIPLAWGEYYLVENRQQAGFDRIQPDFGLLVVRVKPQAQEGSGTATIMDADPGSPNFSHATFRSDLEKRGIFEDKENNIAVIPLWTLGESQGVLVTTLEKSADALKATRAILDARKRQAGADGKNKEAMAACLDAFGNYDFKKSHELARQVK
jgi:hypothetical protein